MIDTHTHLDFECYDNKFDEICKNALDVGVEKMIIPGVQSSGFSKIINLIEKYEFLYGALGIHPSDIKELKSDFESEILELAKHPKIVAIGEIGLDFHWDKDNQEEQKEILKVQIDIAKELNKPLLIHDRDAHEDTFKMLKEKNASEIGVVMHCFSGSSEFAMQCVKEGYYIALGGVVTFKNAKKPKEVVEKVPLNRLLLETDAPYLTPTPYRGQENQPAYVKYVAEEIARIKNISFEEVDAQTTKNAYELFKFDGISNV